MTKWGIIVLLVPITCTFFSLFTMFLGPVIIPVGTVYQLYCLIVELYNTANAMMKVLFRIVKAKLVQLKEKVTQFKFFQRIKECLNGFIQRIRDGLNACY